MPTLKFIILLLYSNLIFVQQVANLNLIVVISIYLILKSIHWNSINTISAFWKYLNVCHNGNKIRYFDCLYIFSLLVKYNAFMKIGVSKLRLINNTLLIKREYKIFTTNLKTCRRAESREQKSKLENKLSVLKNQL